MEEEDNHEKPENFLEMVEGNNVDENIIDLKKIEEEAAEKAKILVNEIKKAKEKLLEEKKIVALTKDKIFEAKGLKAQKLRPVYNFGILHRLFKLVLPATYAIYFTISLNFMLSLSNAGSDISVFIWLWSQQRRNVAYLILGKDKVFVVVVVI